MLCVYIRTMLNINSVPNVKLILIYGLSLRSYNCANLTPRASECIHSILFLFTNFMNKQIYPFN